MAHRISIDSIPIIDNHSHASQLEQRKRHTATTIRQYQEIFAQGYLEARLPPAEWRRYINAIKHRDNATLEELNGTHQVRELMNQSLEMFSSNMFTRTLRLGCTELHGEWENRERLNQLSAEARSQGGGRFFEKVLDRANCPLILADTPRLDRSQWPEKRFRWIVRLDPFLYPFGPGNAAPRGTEVEAFYDRFAYKLELALKEQNLDAPPRDFGDYVDFVERSLESCLRAGAVAFKFVSAYVRSLEFKPVAEGEAARVYRDMAHGYKGESRIFEDYLARKMMLKAASLRVPVQVHCGMGHAEPGMDFFENTPLKLQSVLMDERLSNLPLVLLHGAYPFCSEAGALAWTYGNVYLDFSWMTYLHHHFLIDRLNEWMEYLPANKLVLGTDTGMPEMWAGAVKMGRHAIEAALTRGVEDQIWDESRAMWLAERICYRNVCDIYGISL
jgi:predicted TIM-barrel fold metal-dependent hydrolase